MQPLSTTDLLAVVGRRVYLIDNAEILGKMLIQVKSQNSL